MKPAIEITFWARLLLMSQDPKNGRRNSHKLDEEREIEFQTVIKMQELLLSGGTPGILYGHMQGLQDHHSFQQHPYKMGILTYDQHPERIFSPGFSTPRDFPPS
jgi:hypothetical protein